MFDSLVLSSLTKCFARVSFVRAVDTIVPFTPMTVGTRRFRIIDPRMFAVSSHQSLYFLFFFHHLFPPSCLSDMRRSKGDI